MAYGACECTYLQSPPEPPSMYHMTTMAERPPAMVQHQLRLTPTAAALGLKV